MNLIKRYIQAVKIELPSSQREDIRRELQSTIREELEALHKHAEAVGCGLECWAAPSPEGL